MRFLPAFMLAVLLAACAALTPTPPPTIILPTPTSVVTAPSPTPTPPPVTPTPAPPTPTPTPVVVGVAVAPDVPVIFREPLTAALGRPGLLPGRVVQPTEDDAANRIVLVPLAAVDDPASVLATRVYAAVAPFATVADEVGLAELQRRWADGSLLVGEEATPLAVVFGGLPVRVVSVAGMRSGLEEQPDSVGLLPFDRLDPSFKVLAVDGRNPLDKGLDMATYPLAVALVVRGPQAGELAAALQGAVTPVTNRDPARMTTLIMTGVTAMSRGTAVKMEKKGYTYPAEVISATLRAADITHVSNEVPFIRGCEPRDTPNNLVLCSDYPYWAALEAIGTDIVGLSGNHVNDFGRDGARESLAFYRERGIPVYGSGLNLDEACRPLLWEDHGNTFAFIAALAWWPESAWATPTEPGACPFYQQYDAILTTIAELSRQVDIVAVELQYLETYNPWPTAEQVEDFRTLRAAGADIVTGVQSHVPQAMEPYGADDALGPGIIVYGLGNLFFDQMWSWEVRTGLIARHTVYEGRLLSTEILTTVLEDYAQPRWATPPERAEILRRIFAAAPARPVGGAVRVPTAQPTLMPLASPAPAVTATVTATLPLTNTGGTTGAGAVLPWATPSPAAETHFWLRSPFAAEHNRLATVTYLFGDTQNGRYRVHHGVDIANPLATPVLAPAAATVFYAGPDREPYVFGPYPDFFGNTIVFLLDRTWREQPVYVLYGHLDRIDVSTGERVQPGQPVGTVGMTGIAIGPHLHLEVRLGSPNYGHSYNPALWLEPLPGLGVLAGQVLDTNGRAWTGFNVLLYRLDGERRLVRVVPTYAPDPDLRFDPDWAENFVAADLPAGRYELVFKVANRLYRREARVEAGTLRYEGFVVTGN